MPHSEEEAKAILDPYMDQLGRIFPTAWEKWEAYGEAAPELRLDTCPRTKASMLNNFAAKAAEAVFADRGPEVVLTTKPRFLLMVFHSELHLRLKKYRGSTLRTSGIETGQQQMFEAQQPLPGMPEATNLVHGYVLKNDGSGIAETAIRCATGKVVHWKINVPLLGEAVVLDHKKAATSEPAEPGISSKIVDGKRTEEGGIGG
jgi:hypothetical protein